VTTLNLYNSGMRPISALLLAVLFLTGAGAAQDISVAAAADLQFAFQDVSARFEKETGNKVKLIFGSSGDFYAQIQNGAPFDLFFSADQVYPQKLDASGLAEPGTLQSYAIGKIVLWVRSDSKLDLSRGMQVLLGPTIHKIAVANPHHAPYGRAAVAAMRHENIYGQISSKFLLGENIAQTAVFVATGNADIGIVALSLALAPSMKDKGRYVEVPADDYPAIEQAAIILKSSKQKAAARSFLAFVKSPEIQGLLRGYGFSVPGGP
jgi:molybdate transport system substrate-binding protein